MCFLLLISTSLRSLASTQHFLCRVLTLCKIYKDDLKDCHLQSWLDLLISVICIVKYNQTFLNWYLISTMLLIYFFTAALCLQVFKNKSIHAAVTKKFFIYWSDLSLVWKFKQTIFLAFLNCSEFSAIKDRGRS